jgi:pimeloyl-ACP methyl ester carboxylesterase
VTAIRFARSGDIDVAYRVVGDGPLDLVCVEGAYTHLEIGWELPQYRRYCERLAEFTRLILFDKRGMGMSDRVPGATTLEERMDDIRAVMDAAGSERAAVLGESEGGPLSMLFAAAHPERTVSLVLQGAEVRERRDDDWAWGRATRRSSRLTSHRFPRTGARGSVLATSCRASATSSGVGPGSVACRCMRLHPLRGKRSLGWPSG